jgi:hypothetical protein
MSTLRSTLNSLLALQDIDKDLYRLQRQLAALDPGTVLQQAEEAARIDLDSATKAHQKACADLKDAEMQLATLEKKLSTYNERMKKGSVTNSRELANMERELAQLGRQRSTLDDKALTLMEQTETLKTEMAIAKMRAEEALQKHSAAQAAVSSERERLDQLVQSANVKRTEALGAIDDAALLKKYDQLRSRPAFSGVAVVKAKDGHCEGCHNQISQNAEREAYSSETLTICENCGRILA